MKDEKNKDNYLLYRKKEDYYEKLIDDTWKEFAGIF